MSGWPPSCALPNETSKPKKGKQGIKDLGNKDGRLLLAALQSGELKIVKADLEKIKKNEIAVIATAEPTTFDACTIHARAIFANGKTWIGKSAPKSAALTRIKKRKPAVIDVESGEDEPQQPSIVYTISSSDSEEPPPPAAPKKHDSTIKADFDPDDPGREKQPPVKQPPPPPPVKQRKVAPPKMHISTVNTDSDPDDASTANKKQPHPVPPVKKRAAPMRTASDPDNPAPAKKNQCIPLKQRKRVIVPSSDIEEEDNLEKQCKASLRDASEDPVGSGDDYVHEQDDESESGMVSTPRSRRICAAKTKGKDMKGKTQASAMKTPAPLAGTVRTSETVVPNVHAPPPPSKPMVTAAPAPPAPLPKPMVAPPPKPMVAVPHQPPTRSSIRRTKASQRPMTAAPFTVTLPTQTSLESVPRTTAPDNTIAASGEIPVSRSPMMSLATGTPQAAAQNPQTGQDIVDSFPPSRLISHASQPAPTQPALRLNRTPMPHSSTPESDVRMDEPPYSSQVYGAQYRTEQYDTEQYATEQYGSDQYETERYDDEDYSMDPPYSDYNIHPYNLPLPRYPNNPPQGHARYARRPYARQGSSGAMQYRPPSQRPLPHPSAMRYRPQYGPPRGRGVSIAGPSRVPASSNMGPSNAGPSRVPASLNMGSSNAGPSRVSTSSNMEPSFSRTFNGDQYWSSGQYEGDENDDSNMLS